MTIGKYHISVLTLFSIVLGTLVTGGSTLTLFTDTFGGQRWISIVGLVAGQIQFVVTLYIHETTSSSGPVKSA